MRMEFTNGSILPAGAAALLCALLLCAAARCGAQEPNAAQETLRSLAFAQIISGRPQSATLTRLDIKLPESAAIKLIGGVLLGNEREAAGICAAYTTEQHKEMCLAARAGDERSDCERYRTQLAEGPRKELAEAISDRLRSLEPGPRERVAKFLQVRKFSLPGAAGGGALQPMPETERVIRLQQRGRHWEAVRLINSMMMKRPGISKHYSDRAVQYIYLGKCAQARLDLERALELTPDNAEARYNLSYLNSAGRADCRPAGLPPLKP